MTTGEAIREYARTADAEGLEIEYRTYGPNKEDLFAGACRYENGELIPEDGDSYRLTDEIVKSEVTETTRGKPLLTVWYESKWITGKERLKRGASRAR